MCLINTWSQVHVGKPLLHSFPVQYGLKQAELSLVSNLAIECAIRKVQQSWEDLELNGTHCLLVCADVCSLLGKIINADQYETQKLC